MFVSSPDVSGTEVACWRFACSLHRVFSDVRVSAAFVERGDLWNEESFLTRIILIEMTFWRLFQLDGGGSLSQRVVI
jgi:hypothetical protein